MTDQERIEREEVAQFISLYPKLLALAVQQKAPIVLDKVRLLPTGDVEEFWGGAWVPCDPSHLASLMTHTPIVAEAERIAHRMIMSN